MENINNKDSEPTYNKSFNTLKSNQYTSFSCLKCRCEITLPKNSLSFLCFDCNKDVINLDRIKMLFEGFTFTQKCDF